MYRAAVKYKGVWLAPGSHAAQLHADKKFKELDKHLLELEEAERRRQTGG